ncbi:unnamed protein product, partial [Rotaria sp. Silwood2]
MQQVCHRKYDCPLMNDDERLCPWHFNSICRGWNEFTCMNGTCLKAGDRCNEFVDCIPDGEDEWA